MTTTSTSRSSESFSITAVSVVLVGATIFGYGLLVVPQSTLGGAWIAAIGLSMLFSGLVSTVWAGDRLGLSAADRRRLSLTLAVLAAVLTVAFIVVNGATFESGEMASSG